MKMVHHLPLVLLLLLIISRIRAQQQQPPSYVYVFAPHGTGDTLLFASITELSRSTAASNNSTGSCILTSNMRYDKETKSLKPSSFPRTVRELKAQCPQGGFLFTRLAKGLDEEKARADQLRAATGGGGGGGGGGRELLLLWKGGSGGGRRQGGGAHSHHHGVHLFCCAPAARSSSRFLYL